MLRRRLGLLVIVPLCLVLAGTLGYWLIEPEYTLFDSVYMTITTLTTVGYGEVHPLSATGRWFTMALLLGGVFTLFYTATEMIRIIVSGEMGRALGKQRMERNLAELHNHVIVCGYGRMGRLVCRQLAAHETAFVLIERQSDLLEDFEVPHGLALHGDATSDLMLKKARIERARALVTVLSSDADNLYITLSARLLNEGLFIVARAEDERAEEKLSRAGANRVVSPYAIGGARVAHAVLQPNVTDFLELATRRDYLELQIEETEVAPGSPLAGVSVKDSELRQKLDLMIVAIKRKSGPLVHNPPPDAVIEAGDILIALGHRQQLDRLEMMARATEG